MGRLELSLGGAGNKLKRWFAPLALSGISLMAFSSGEIRADDYKPTYRDTETTIKSISSEAGTFKSYINNNQPSTINNYLGLGVGAANPPPKYESRFDKIVSLTTGNAQVDYGIATVDTFKIPLTQLKEIQGQTINNAWVHSWHAPVLINEIKMGHVKVNNLILIDPPGVIDYSDLKKHGTSVTVYSADKNFFKYLPEPFLGSDKQSMTLHEIKGIDRGSTRVGTTTGLKWNIPLPEQREVRGNFMQGNTGHSLESCLDKMFQMRPELLNKLNYNPRNPVNVTMPSKEITSPTRLTTPSPIRLPSSDLKSFIPPSRFIEPRRIAPSWGNSGNFQRGYMNPIISSPPITMPKYNSIPYKPPVMLPNYSTPYKPPVMPRIQHVQPRR